MSELLNFPPKSIAKAVLATLSISTSSGRSLVRQAERVKTSGIPSRKAWWEYIAADWESLNEAQWTLEDLTSSMHISRDILPCISFSTTSQTTLFPSGLDLSIRIFRF